MKKLYYDEGPSLMSFGDAGTFVLGEPKEVVDGLANVLLRKGRLKEYKETPPDPPATRGGKAGIVQKKEE